MWVDGQRFLFAASHYEGFFFFLVTVIVPPRYNERCLSHHKSTCNWEGNPTTVGGVGVSFRIWSTFLFQASGWLLLFLHSQNPSASRSEYRHLGNTSFWSVRFSI